MRKVHNAQVLVQCKFYTLSACACNGKPLKSLLVKNVIQGSSPFEGPGAKTYLSQCMGFPTMWYVRPAKPQISLRIRAV